MLGLNAAAVQVPIGEEAGLEGYVDLVEEKAFFFGGENGETLTEKPMPENMQELFAEKRQVLIEAVSDCDEELGLPASFPHSERVWSSFVLLR